MMPKLSLVTGTRNRPESFQRLLSSIVVNTSVPWELVVADASDVPMDATHLREEVRILPERPRLGCVKGYNRAFRECLGEFVLWLNDDCEVCPGYDTAAIEFMEQYPQTGLGALHYSEKGGEFHVNAAYRALYANFGIIRKQLGDAVGWFNESLEMYGCDNSLTFKVLLENYGVNDIPGARIIHHSEQDDERRQNQRSRRRDNETLTETYMSMRHHWLMSFHRNRVHTGTIPWEHGCAPETVNR